MPKLEVIIQVISYLSFMYYFLQRSNLMLLPYNLFLKLNTSFVIFKNAEKDVNTLTSFQTASTRSKQEEISSKGRNPSRVYS